MPNSTSNASSFEIIQNYPVIKATDHIRDIKDIIVRYGFAVVKDNGSYMEIFTKDDVLLSRHMLVGDCLRKKPILLPGMPHCKVLEQFESSGSPALPVFENGTFMGIALRQSVLSADTGKETSEIEFQDIKNDLFARANIGICIVDSKGTIVSVNPAFLKQSGYVQDNLLSKSGFDLLVPEEKKKGETFLKAITDNGEAKAICKVKKADESTNFALLIGKKLKQNCIILFINDITETITNKQILQAERDYAYDVYRSKSDFIASMSHEIRTPLHAILGMSQLVQSLRISPEHRRYINSITASSKHLYTLINNILDISKIEAGKLQLNYETFKLKPLMQELVSAFFPQIEQKGVGLELEISAALPKEMRTDKARLRQILYNLIGNAVKHTKKGKITIKAESAEADSAQNPSSSYTPTGNVPDKTLELNRPVTFMVKDTGPGIPENKKEFIFQKFTQLDNNLAQNNGQKEDKQVKGTGLGLAISKDLAELMCGKIEVESTPGHGSVFSVTIPFYDADKTNGCKNSDYLDISGPGIQDKTAKITGHADNNNRHGNWAVGFSNANSKTDTVHPIKILVTDDHKESRFVMKAFLKKIGHKAVFAETGTKAIEKLSSDTFNLLLLDIELPDKTGYEVSQAIRDGKAGEHSRDIPIIALTAHNLNEVREQCRDADMDDFLAKPLDLSQLHEKISDLASLYSESHLSDENKLSTNKNTDSKQTETSSGCNPKHPGTQLPYCHVLDAENGIKKLGNDISLYTEMVENFKSTLPDTIVLVEKALKDKSTDKLQSVAHRLLSTTGSIGAKPCYSLCSDIEYAYYGGEQAEKILEHGEKLKKELYTLKDKLS